MRDLAGVRDGSGRTCGQGNAGSQVESRVHKNLTYLRGRQRLRAVCRRIVLLGVAGVAQRPVLGRQRQRGRVECVQRQRAGRVAGEAGREEDVLAVAHARGEGGGDVRNERVCAAVVGVAGGLQSGGAEEEDEPGAGAARDSEEGCAVRCGGWWR